MTNSFDGISEAIAPIRDACNTVLISNDFTTPCNPKLLIALGEHFSEISGILGKNDEIFFQASFEFLNAYIQKILFQEKDYLATMPALLRYYDVLDITLDCWLIQKELNDDDKEILSGMQDALANQQSDDVTDIPFPEEGNLTAATEKNADKRNVEIFVVPDNLDELTGSFGFLNAEILEEEQDIIDVFIPEALDSLENMEQNLLLIEEDPFNKESINSAFRSIHTIKGVASFLNYQEIILLSTGAEMLLDKCRNDELSPNSQLVNVMFDVIDLLHTLLNNLQLRIKIVNKKNVSQEIQLIDMRTVLYSLQLLLSMTQSVEEILKPVQEKSQSIPDSSPKIVQTLKSESIRVPVEKIDVISDAVGELLISLSLLKQTAENKDTLHNIDMITDLLYANILKMRMFPIKSIYDKINRQIRDLINKSGKKVKFVTFGAETEVDKVILDEIYAPLTHIIRNSMDHGIEDAETRLANNKAAIATISLSTTIQGNNVVIEIIDDGGGLNKEKILQKAHLKKLTSKKDTLSDQQIYEFIFHPGFSTAEKVSEISGRGVGMDVVKKTIQSLAGDIKLSSTLGKGTTVAFHLPLSTSIIEGLVVKVADFKFIIPVLQIKHTMINKKDMLNNLYNNKGAFHIFQNKTVPLIDLGEFYSIPDYKMQVAPTLLLIEFNLEIFGLVVDEILYRQKVVTKSLSKEYENVCGIKAGTILGDGSIGLILEPRDIIEEHKSNNINESINK